MNDSPRADDRRGDLRVPLGIAALGALIHLPWLTRYGWFRDELYYVACARRLDWGYVDHPPLSILVLAAWRAVAGDSLAALRVIPALAFGGTIFLAGLLAREAGGGRFAQALAALAMLVGPVALATTHVYSMNAIDLLLWALAGWLLSRALHARDAAAWPVLGLVLGLGLLNKLSVLWLGAGLFVALLATRHRAALRTPGPWIAFGIAGSLLVPHLLWQQAHDWPTLEFMRNATAHKMRKVTLLGFAIRQVMENHPVTAPLWLAGLIAPFAARRLAPWRPVTLIWIAVAALLVLTGRSRASYLAPAMPFVLAPGAVAIEGWLRGRAWRAAALALVVVMGAITLPLALPMLDPAGYVRHARALGVAPQSDENHRMGRLPQHFADMFGWEELAREVGAIAATLTPEERARAVVFARNYGEAGALERFGPKYGVPRVISPHNNYWLWGPGPAEPRPLAIIVLGGAREDNAAAFETLEDRGTIGCEHCMPYERETRIYLGRRPRVRLEAIWPDERVFH